MCICWKFLSYNSSDSSKKRNHTNTVIFRSDTCIFGRRLLPPTKKQQRRKRFCTAVAEATKMFFFIVGILFVYCLVLCHSVDVALKFRSFIFDLFSRGYAYVEFNAIFSSFWYIASSVNCMQYESAAMKWVRHVILLAKRTQQQMHLPYVWSYAVFIRISIRQISYFLFNFCVYWIRGEGKKDTINLLDAYYDILLIENYSELVSMPCIECMHACSAFGQCTRLFSFLFLCLKGIWYARQNANDSHKTCSIHKATTINWRQLKMKYVWKEANGAEISLIDVSHAFP